MAYAGGPRCLARGLSLHSHRGGRLEEAQTSGAGWAPCDVYGRECEWWSKQPGCLDGSLGIVGLSDSSIPLCCVIGSKLLNLSELSPFSLYEGENDIYLLFTSDKICCTLEEEEQGKELK